MDSSSTADVLSSLQQFGFAVIKLPDQVVLTALQAEAAAALEQADAAAMADGVCTEDVVQQMGCVFQVLPDLDANHPNRQSAQYWQQRSSWPCQQAVAMWLQSKALQQLLQAVLGCQAVLLYNEQFIIKPPNIHLGSAFGWHCDSQYASSSGRSVTRSPYLSLWVALDDMTAENGCLIVLPGSHTNATCGVLTTGLQDVKYTNVTNTQDCLQQLSTLQPHQQLKTSDTTANPPSGSCKACCCRSSSAHGTSMDSNMCNRQALGLIMPAGTAALFWDDLWHCSGPNSSSHTRCAYMAQFSSEPITWQDTGELVGLAVPLMVRHAAAGKA